MLAFLKEMSNFNQVFILRTIRSTIRYACAIIKNRINCVIARENGCECQITKLQVEWLGCRAFCDVLTLKRSKCFGILRALKANLEEKRFLQLGKRMDLIIEESKSAVLRSILF
ncbi:hypothetical protein M427DRAFT_152147 [Gonapodya prolifera JEL478]|uniref:Telomerase reverse transcriptase C-terminal extension domain-containing protein n=1 Tax=Gonapodya prolifera (strain JEL478) TaxID=1344416 RepID=A0A139AU66_GONPJ|nr:hypothetical protein M427DRAFT_152147 [Gonapodya prolifera JEL478]|eukprot:KXS20286.1 hypothetical protein M427DRAFT_152147 [Gonapodya prolifera JEL478]